MRKGIFKNIRAFSFWIGLTVGIVASSASLTAHAATGVPSQFEYLNSNVLIVNIAGVNYQAQLSSPGCGLPANSIDVLRIWLSMAQAAVLAGKSINIYPTTCNSLNWITDIVFYK
jgi:hypothetical protein